AARSCSYMRWRYGTRRGCRRGGLCWRFDSIAAHPVARTSVDPGAGRVHFDANRVMAGFLGTRRIAHLVSPSQLDSHATDGAFEFLLLADMELRATGRCGESRERVGGVRGPATAIEDR